MWCTYSLWRMLYTLGKLIGLLFLFFPTPSSLFCFNFENSKNTRNELAHPVMGNSFLVIIIIKFFRQVFSEYTDTEANAHLYVH